MTEPEEKKDNVIDLMEALRNSVKGKRSAPVKKRRPTKPAAERRRKAA
jgi:non-homologous end joining protein Ku